jgi:ribosomal protein S30
MKTQKKSHEHEQPNENNTKDYHRSIEKNEQGT